MDDKEYPGDAAIFAYKLCFEAFRRMEIFIPAAKGVLGAVEVVSEALKERPRGRRAAIEAQKRRKPNKS